MIHDPTQLDHVGQRQRRRHKFAAAQAALRMASAMSLSGVHGQPYLHGQPVAWKGNSRQIFHPLADSKVDDEYVGNDMLVDSIVHDRAHGLRVLAADGVGITTSVFGSLCGRGEGNSSCRSD